MQPSAVSPNVFRFGLFEVDLAAGELRKGDRKVVLQEQPFKLLLVLLQRPGEVVTREELQQSLWPADTFVEFDESLNKAVQKLRHALGDPSDRPHVIETVARRGYRFIAPVEPVGSRERRPAEQARDARSPHGNVRQLWNERTFWMLGLAAAMGIIITLWISKPIPSALRVRKFTFSAKGSCATPVISPDGQLIAYVTTTPSNDPSRPVVAGTPTRLWVQDLAQEEPREINDTQGTQPWPFWSPDSEFLGFATRNHLWRVASHKGVPSPICEISDQFLGATWNPDGNSIVFSINHQGIYEVSANGGRPKMLIPAAHDAPGDHFDNPYWLPTPGRNRILLYAMRRVGAVHDVILHSLESGKRTVLIPGAVFAVYSATGHILYGQTTGGG